MSGVIYDFENCSLQNLNDDFIKHQKSYEIWRTAVPKIVMMNINYVRSLMRFFKPQFPKS